MLIVFRELQISFLGERIIFWRMLIAFGRQLIGF